MDALDLKIQEYVQSHKRIEDNDMLFRLQKAGELFLRCLDCQKDDFDGSSGLYGFVPPSESWAASHPKCKSCECRKWISAHSK